MFLLPRTPGTESRYSRSIHAPTHHNVNQRKTKSAVSIEAPPYPYCCIPHHLTASLVWCAAGILDKYRSAASSAAKAPLAATPSGGFCFAALACRRWRWLRTHSRASKSATSLSYATLRKRNGAAAAAAREAAWSGRSQSSVQCRWALTTCYALKGPAHKSNSTRQSNSHFHWA